VRTRTTLLICALTLLALPALAGQQPSLDYDYFKTRVQPIFAAKRPGHARCISCHGSGTPLRLQPLAQGATTWTDEESQKNFQAVRRVASAGVKSRLLTHPLEESAGGDFYHSGGKHWTSQNDPEWKVLQAFVTGATK
jgi:hypothetical protein